MPVIISLSDRGNTKPSSLLLIKSWYKSLIVKFRTEIAQSRLHENCQTNKIYSKRHSWRHGNVIYVFQYESLPLSQWVKYKHTILFMEQQALDRACLTGITGDPLHSRALAHSRAPLFTQPCPHCSHSRAPAEQWARLCVFTLQGCVQAARLCRGSPVGMCMWLTSLDIFKLITQDRSCSRECFRAV